jgi:hypothetical protein
MTFEISEQDVHPQTPEFDSPVSTSSHDVQLI